MPVADRARSHPEVKVEFPGRERTHGGPRPVALAACARPPDLEFVGIAVENRDDVDPLALPERAGRAALAGNSEDIAGRGAARIARVHRGHGDIGLSTR